MRDSRMSVTSGVSDRVTSTVVTDIVCMADIAETSIVQKRIAAGVHVRTTLLLYFTRSPKMACPLGATATITPKAASVARFWSVQSQNGKLKALIAALLRMVIELEAMQ